MGTYWQPSIFISHEENIHALKTLLPYAYNMHVFFWDKDYTRFALEDGAKEWEEYMAIAKTNPNIGAAMLEFIKDDSLEQMKRDAAVLNKLAKG